MMDVAKRIKQIRESCHYSQNYLADIAGISQTHLRRVELGEADITVGHLRLVCDALGITLGEFFTAETEGDDIAAAIRRLTPKQKTLLLEFIKSL